MSDTGSCCQGPQDPCLSDVCAACHTVENVTTIYAPDQIDHYPGTHYGPSEFYDLPKPANICNVRNGPGMWTASGRGFNSTGTGPYGGGDGSVQLINPYAPATPDNGDALSYLTTYLVAGDLHIGWNNPYYTARPFQVFGNQILGPRFQPWHWNQMWCNYHIPVTAFIAAEGGTHFTKTFQADFSTEHFGLDNGTDPIVYEDDQVDNEETVFCMGTMDYHGPIGESSQNTNRSITTQRSGLTFGMSTFRPWTRFNGSGGFNGDVELFALSAGAACTESTNSDARLLPMNWSNGNNIDQTTVFVDSDNNGFFAYEEIVQAEANRKVFLTLPKAQYVGGTLIDASSGFTPFFNGGTGGKYVIDTGGTVADFDSGHTVLMEAETTNVSHDEQCNWIVNYNLRIQIPTVSFDRTFAMQVTISRCGGDWGQRLGLWWAGSVHRSQVKQPSGRIDYGSATELVTCLNDATHTTVTTEDVSTWTGWVNDHVVDPPYRSRTRKPTGMEIDDPNNFTAEHGKMTGYINRVSFLEVGDNGEVHPDVGLVLSEARYNFDSGAQAILKAGEFGTTSIPNNHTWDVMAEPNWEAPVAGDTVELVFENYGVNPASITDCTFDGDLFSAVDKTTATVAPYSREVITYTVKAGLVLPAIYEDTTVTEHDEDGNFIADPFNFTVRQGDMLIVDPGL